MLCILILLCTLTNALEKVPILSYGFNILSLPLSYSGELTSRVNVVINLSKDITAPLLGIHLFHLPAVSAGET